MNKHWTKSGQPGHVIVTGEAGRYLAVDVYDSSGAFSHTDRMPKDKETGGPRGYVDAASVETPARKARTHHDWGRPVPVDGERWGQRCTCGLERQELGAGGRYLFRRPGGGWTASEKTPACEATT